MKKSNEDIEIEENLRQLVQTKDLNVKVDKNGTEQYSLTEKGLKDTKEKLQKNEDYQLLLFTITFNMESTKAYKEHNTPGKFTALKKTLDWMVKEINPNFNEVFYRAVRDGKIQGISLNNQKESSVK